MNFSVFSPFLLSNYRIMLFCCMGKRTHAHIKKNVKNEREEGKNNGKMTDKQ